MVLRLPNPNYRSSSIAPKYGRVLCIGSKRAFISALAL